MSKEIFLKNDAKEILLDGINELANVVRITLGPNGKNVIIQDEFKKPFITNDGATIARELILSNPTLNVGAELIKEVALKTNDLVGDGTTTATILAVSLINESMKSIKSGVNPLKLKENLELLSNKIVKYLEQNAIIINSYKEIKTIAKIASKSDELANIFEEIVKIIGNNGLIKLENTKNSKTTYEVMDGYILDNGYASSVFANTEIQNCIFDNSHILITNEDIYDINFLNDIFLKMQKTGCSLVIICNSISEPALSNVISLKEKNDLKIAVVNLIDTNNYRDEILKDISYLTNGKFFSKEISNNFNNLSFNDLGFTKKIIINKETTKLINDKEVDEYLKNLEKLIGLATTNFEKEILNHRYYQLAKKYAIIKIGGQTELEITEKMMKAEDALGAINATVKSGVLPGGGSAYIKATSILQYKEYTSKEEKMAVNIMKETLFAPFKQLLLNSEIYFEQELLDNILESEFNYGYNLFNQKVENLIDSNIIDPTLVEIVALKNAVSIACLIITTDALLVDSSYDSLLKKEINNQIIKDSISGMR